MGKSLSDSGTYNYKVQCEDSELEGQKIELRRMSEKERGLFLKKKAKFLLILYTNSINSITGGTIDPDQYETIEKQARKLIGQVVADGQREMLKEFFGSGDYAIDWLFLIHRICSVEAALSSGEDVPEQFTLSSPDAVDAADEQELSEIEREARGLGESSAPSGQAMTTQPTDSPAEIPSDGSDESSTDIE